MLCRENKQEVIQFDALVKMIENLPSTPSPLISLIIYPVFSVSLSII